MRRNKLMVVSSGIIFIWIFVFARVIAAADTEKLEDASAVREMVVTRASQSDIEAIGQLSGLRKLELDIGKGEFDLTPLTNLQNLEELSVSVHGDAAWYEKTDLSPLGGLKQLKVLYITECSADLSFVNMLKDLKLLSVSRSVVDDLSFLQGLNELEYLNLNYVEDSDLSYLKGMSKIKNIYIQGHHMRNFEYLGEMKYITQVYLKELEYNQEERQDIDLNVFAEADKLSGLFIQGMYVADVAPISRLENLKEIVFVDTEVADIESLKDLENLEDLEIYGYGYRTVIEQAVSMTKVERLIITDDIPNCYTH